MNLPWKLFKQNISGLSVPPVVALSVEQRLGVAVQRLDFVGFIVALLGVVEGHTEGCLLNGVQSLLVLTTAEEGFTSLGPWSPAECQITAFWSGRSQAMAYCLLQPFLHCTVTFIALFYTHLILF